MTVERFGSPIFKPFAVVCVGSSGGSSFVAS